MPTCFILTRVGTLGSVGGSRFCTLTDLFPNCGTSCRFKIVDASFKFMHLLLFINFPLQQQSSEEVNTFWCLTELRSSIMIITFSQ